MKIFKSKKGLELTISFLVKLIMAIVVFAFGIWFAGTIFSTGGDITDKAFTDWDKQVSGLSCSPGQKVCIPRTTRETETEDGIVYGLVIKNVMDIERDFQYWVEGYGGGDQPTSFVDQGGEVVTQTELTQAGDSFNFIPKSSLKRTVPELGSGKDVSMGVVLQHIGPTRGTAAFTVIVEYDKGSNDWEEYGRFKVYLRTI